MVFVWFANDASRWENKKQVYSQVILLGPTCARLSSHCCNITFFGNKKSQQVQILPQKRSRAVDNWCLLVFTQFDSERRTAKDSFRHCLISVHPHERREHVVIGLTMTHQPQVLERRHFVRHEWINQSSCSEYGCAYLQVIGGYWQLHAQSTNNMICWPTRYDLLDWATITYLWGLLLSMQSPAHVWSWQMYRSLLR